MLKTPRDKNPPSIYCSLVRITQNFPMGAYHSITVFLRDTAYWSFESAYLFEKKKGVSPSSRFPTD